MEKTYSIKNIVGNKTNITSKLLISDGFIRDVKKYKNVILKFLTFVQKNIYEKGIEFLESKKNEKLLSNTKTKVYEFRSPIKGHRLFFKYGWQCDHENVRDLDIILCGYQNNHDRITEGANSITNITINEEWTDKLDIKDFEVVESDTNETFNHNKLSYFNENITLNYLPPVLDIEQENILKDTKQYVLVNGIAGSGKTNLCIQKALFESLKNKKVLYSTFSEKLLNQTQNFINDNYITEIDKIKRQTKREGITDSIILKFNNLNLNNIDLNNLDVTLSEIYNQFKKIDYKLPYQIYNEINHENCKVVDYKIFGGLFNSSSMVSYDIKNRFKNLNLTLEVVFKEIEGVVLGLKSNDKIISFDEYYQERKDVFNEKQLKIIYEIANSYLDYILKSNEYIDKNIIANILLNDFSLKEKYDIIILDEVQDFTQKELLAFKYMSKSIFAVGDPLQMINPAYFSFNKFKQLLGSNHKEYILDLNYRNTKHINSAINKLLDINKDKLGFHSNILKQVKTADIQESTYLFFTDSNEVFNGLNKSEFNDYTIVVASDDEKMDLPEKEVFTIADVKGLERNTIVLYNVLSKHLTEWLKLENNYINKKIADENSLIRYYFNIFYVGMTRAQRNVLVIENSNIQTFNEFFKNNFVYLDKDISIEELQIKLDLSILSLEETINRINDSLTNNLFERANHYISWIKDKQEKEKQTLRLEIYQTIEEKKNHNEMIDKCLELNLIEDAVQIARKNKDYETANIIHQIFETKEQSISLMLEILTKTESEILTKIIKSRLGKSRKDLFESNQILKEMLKEI